jgi:hypothetical protein
MTAPTPLLVAVLVVDTVVVAAADFEPPASVTVADAACPVPVGLAVFAFVSLI